jgi:MPBQ/MSBQ methyltransferase
VTTAAPNPELMIAHRVFRLDHLHLGYSEPGRRLTLGDLHAAQRNFTRKLISLFPPGTRRVLDVGCGVGVGTRMLRDAGFDVRAVNPDSYQQREFARNLPGTTLYPCRFENLRTADRFDLVLFSESAQYIPPADLFAGCRTLLDRQGPQSVLVADYFPRSGRTYVGMDVPLIGDEVFLQRSVEAGFATECVEDITEWTIPTMECLAGFHREHVVPAVETAEELLHTRLPWWLRLLVRLFSGRWRAMRRHVVERMAERLDPENYRRSGRYCIYRFRGTATAPQDGRSHSTAGAVPAVESIAPRAADIVA